jgi:uncharacterized membrane protein YccC
MHGCALGAAILLWRGELLGRRPRLSLSQGFRLRRLGQQLARNMTMLGRIRRRLHRAIFSRIARLCRTSRSPPNRQLFRPCRKVPK